MLMILAWEKQFDFEVIELICFTKVWNWQRNLGIVQIFWSIYAIKKKIDQPVHCTELNKKLRVLNGQIRFVEQTIYIVWIV